MIINNGKRIAFSSFFSIKAGEEVVITHADLGNFVMRFTAAAGVTADQSPSNFDLQENEVRLPIPLLDEGQRAMENQFLGMVGSSALSARYILQGAGLYTIVHVEFYLGIDAR